jgi:transcription elongation factor Elf1
MGLLNPTINLRTCLVCQRHGIKPPLVDLHSLTYDYVCPTCNPNTTISVTDVTFGTKVLEALKDNPEARAKLREEISAFEGEIYRVDTNVVQYFLGQAKHKPIIFHDWLSGNLTGDVRNWPVSNDDLIKIKMEQKKIFEKMVAKKFEHYKESFDKRRANSINLSQMLVKESTI